MRAEYLAVMTAALWGIGSFFEKKGLLLGHLNPGVGAVIRTSVALVVLLLFALPHIGGIARAGYKPVLLVAIGGGLLAGAFGIISFYAALKVGTLGKVLPIAFTSPFFGVLIAVIMGTEALTVRVLLGMLLTISGIMVLTWK